MIGRAITTVGSYSGYEYAENDEKRSYGEKYNLFADNYKEQWEEMTAIANLNDTVKRKKYVNALISFDKSQNPENLTNNQLREIAETYAKEIGFFYNQWKFAVHTNTDELHIHFFANRIGFDGNNTVKAHNIGKRSGEITNKIAKKLGLKTAKEIGNERKEKALNALVLAMGNSKNWEELEAEMLNLNYHFKLSRNKKGINGARIVPTEYMKSENELSEREKISGKGYKLSELSRKLRIKDIEEKLISNKNNHNKTLTKNKFLKL